VKVVRAGWTSASFLVYAGALVVLLASSAWLGVISDKHSDGAFAGWSALFWAIAEVLALLLLVKGRRLVAGLFAFVGLGLWAAMVGAFFDWFGWLPDDDRPLGGFHWGVLALELLVLLAALVDLRIFRFPLLVAIAAPLSWYFVTDVLSSGGDWSATVTLLVGLALFFVGLSLDRGDSRPYGFWVHVTAGLTVAGALLYWWHSTDADWALIIVASLAFVAVGAAARRSSYAVLGVIGMALATGYFSFGEALGLTENPRPTTWEGPVGYLGLGFFLVLLGMLLRRRGAESASA
jgi:hypothetical protein